MKRLSIILCLGAAVLSLASCNREQLVPDGLYTIKASREGDAATKTYVDDALNLVWAKDDKIGVFNGNNTNVAYTLSLGEGSASAEFSGDTPFAEEALFAYYPYSEANKNSAAIVVDLSNQTYATPSDFGQYFYMVGSADVKEGATDINIDFMNPLAAFVFTVDNQLDHAIKVTGFSVSNSESVFYQKATLNLTADDPTKLTTTNDDLTKEISVTIEDIEVASGAELDFPLVVIPASLADKKLFFTFSYTSNGEPKTVTKSVSGKNISRNTFIPGTFTLEESTIGGDIESSWDGSSISEPETDPDDENTYLISTPAELAWVAQQVNGNKDNFENKTLLLTNDINLNGHHWTPIGNVTSYPGISFHGTFDGQGYTISNLTASDNAKGYAAAGLFGSLMGTVKNVTLKNVNIRSTHYAGAVVAYSSAKPNGITIIDNCHVDGGTITSVPEFTGTSYDSGDKAGGIIGYYATDDKVTNCSAKNLIITAYRELGGITGCGPKSGMTDCSVENITLVQDNTNGYETKAVTTIGALGGRDVTNGDQPYDGEFASKVTKKVVGNVSNAAQLASALTSDAAQIAVTLVEDIDLSIASLGQQTGGSGEYKLGGENTESIMIDLDNHKLNLTTTYMSAIGAKNDDAVFTIKNGTMTSSSTSSTWNIYDLTFANCNYEIENVVFEKSIAFTNDNRTARLDNVTINEQNGDYYAMWISAVGQNITIDGLTLSSTGRGIKIDEEYVNNPAKVTLNISNSKFTTVSKAAIMVDSKEGAEINVTNVDIANVAADPVFTVWVDEDAKAYADKVIVSGAKVRIEGSNEQIVATSNEELAAADIANNATIYLTKDAYVIPDAAKGKTVTFIGTGNPEDTIIECKDDGYDKLNGSTVTFENLTIETDNVTYRGFIHVSGATYKNCIIKNQLTLYSNGNPLLFDNCTFQVSGNNYNVWTWGTSATFEDCIFNCDGKAMLVYGGGTSEVTFTNCIFNDFGGQTGKAAIETGNDYDATYTININKCEVNGFDINSVSGSKVWGNKNSMTPDKLNVIIDNVEVY